MEEEELYEALRRKGYEPTGSVTSTGAWWRHRDSGSLIQVPDSDGGIYPNWLLEEIERQVGPLF